MANDPLGFYSDLGVSPTASHEEIRAVYRALAKIYHPDVNKDKAAAEKFRRVTAAYEVLCDPNNRATYDKKSQPRPTKPEVHTETAQQTPQVLIVECSVCKKPTAQPRFLIFKQVASFLFVTNVTPKAGVYCSACATQQALRCTIKSAAFGWWGLPWGPIYTIIYGLQNAFGGERNKAVDEQLLWQNAIAFNRRGNVQLAGALAHSLLFARDRGIAVAALQLKQAMQADGLIIKPFKSAWGFSLGKTLKHVAALMTVPLIVGSLAYASSVGPGSVNALTAVPPIHPAGAPVAQNVPAPKPLVNQCKRPPKSGQVLYRRAELSDEGHKISIENGSDGDAIIKIRDDFFLHTLLSLFVAKDEMASISGLDDGEYKIQFATGTAMTSNCQGFIEPNASEFTGTESFTTTYTSSNIITQQLELTLYKVVGGNASTSAIRPADFQKD